MPLIKHPIHKDKNAQWMPSKHLAKNDWCNHIIVSLPTIPMRLLTSFCVTHYHLVWYSRYKKKPTSTYRFKHNNKARGVTYTLEHASSYLLLLRPRKRDRSRLSTLSGMVSTTAATGFSGTTHNMVYGWPTNVLHTSTSWIVFFS